MREDLVHVHVLDSNRVIPGEGRVDWIGLLQALDECGYTGYLTMELGLDSRAADPDQIARTALRFLKGVESQLNCDRGR
jgi:fructoselysine 3-epimerase